MRIRTVIGAVVIGVPSPESRSFELGPRLSTFSAGRITHDPLAVEIEKA